MKLLPITARRQIRLAAFRALQDANFNIPIYSPGDWTTQSTRTPEIKIRTPLDRRESKLKGQVEFDTTVTLEVLLTIAGASAEEVQDRLDALSYQVEKILFASYWIIRSSQQVASCDTEEEFSSDGKQHIGRVKYTIGYEVFEAFDPLEDDPSDSDWPPDDFIPAPLESMHIEIVEPDGTQRSAADIELNS